MINHEKNVADEIGTDDVKLCCSENVCAFKSDESAMRGSTNELTDFVIENGRLIKYCGHSQNVIIPNCVMEIGNRAFARLHFVRILKA